MSPFALQMRRGFERSKDARAREAAQLQVDSVMRFLEAFLVQTTERVEVANRKDEKDVINNDPEYDLREEITPTMEQLAMALGETPENLRNPYGTIVGYDIEDESGKVNINSASPFALGNLLGLSVLAKELSESDTTIELEDASKFPPQGYVKVGRELVKYTGKDGNRPTGCERKIASGASWVVHSC